MNTSSDQYRSADHLQKQYIKEAITGLLNGSLRKDIGLDWDKVAVKCVDASSLGQLQRSAKILLGQLMREEAVVKIRQSRGVPETAVFLLDENGRLFYSYENLITETQEPAEPLTIDIDADLSDETPLKTYTTVFFSPRDISADLVNVTDYQEQLDSLASMARLSGGWIITGDNITVGQWLRFNDLPQADNGDDVHTLIDLLNYGELPAPPKYGNYWQLLETPEGSPFELTEAIRSTIRQTTSALLGDGLLVNELGVGLIIESGSPDGLPQSQGYRVQRLIEQGVGYAQTFLDALDGFIDESSPASPEIIEQLMVAAMLLDLDKDCDSANTSFAGFDLYSSHFLRKRPAYVRERLELYLIDRSGVNRVLAPLVAELVLAGMAPEYLFADWPEDLLLGTPAWVVATQAVHFAEALIPGVTRQMSYQHLMGFSQSVQASEQLAAIQNTNGCDAVVTWALMNSLIERDADGSLSEAAVMQATQQYESFTQLALDAVTKLAKPAPERKAMALAELVKQVPGLDPYTKLFSYFDSSGRSLIDNYMDRTLYSGEWYPRDAKNIYKEFPQLLTLPNISDVYELAINQYHDDMTQALENNIVQTLSQMQREDSLLLEHGKLGIYRVKKATVHHSRYDPNVDRTLRPVRGEFGRFGFILCVANGLNVRCFELFPLRMECTRNPQLESHFASLVSGTSLTFADNGAWEKAPLDVMASLKNNPREPDKYENIYVEKMAEFKPQGHEKIAGYPNRYFRSPRKEAISRLIATDCPYITRAELKAIGLNPTQREAHWATYDAILNTILNLVIPFKECVQELSSGDRARRQSAVGGCIVDVAVIAVTAAFLPGKIAASVSKSIHVFTRLLTASRVVASTVLSLFNPLSGAGKLLRGAGKLAWRGAGKLSGVAASATHAARHQLRNITGSNSYNLIKAINHSGEASKIRMSLDPVSHARALFKDDSLTTVEQIVARLSDQTKALPKHTAVIELEHLYNNALVETARKSAVSQDLQSVLGRGAFDDLSHAAIKNFGLGYSPKLVPAREGPAAILEIFYKMERKKIDYMTAYQRKVLTLDLGKPPYNIPMAESVFNAKGVTDNAQRAGLWIVNESTSKGNNLESITAVLREYAGNGKSLTDPNVIQALHKRLAPLTSHIVRIRSDEVLYASSISGFALLEKHLKLLDKSHPFFDKHLLASVVGFHALGDGNGRTGRALYAISQLRSNRFVPMTISEFALLHGVT